MHDAVAAGEEVTVLVLRIVEDIVLQLEFVLMTDIKWNHEGNKNRIEVILYTMRWGTSAFLMHNIKNNDDAMVQEKDQRGPSDLELWASASTPALLPRTEVGVYERMNEIQW